MVPREVVILHHIKSVWLGLSCIPTPAIGDRINTAGNFMDLECWSREERMGEIGKGKKLVRMFDILIWVMIT